MTTYTVTAERGASGVWVLQCEQFPGAISETRSLSSAESLMREAIAFVADLDEADIDIDLAVQLPMGLSDDVRRARLAVAELAQAQEDTARLSRDVARKLLGAGLTGREISVVLKVSPQRVSQLVR